MKSMILCQHGNANDDCPRCGNMSYEDAMHGVQCGAGHLINLDNPSLPDTLLRTLKHIRTGIDSAHVSDAAMAQLLISKGIITEDEYKEAVRVEANKELARYEKVVSDRMGGAAISLRGLKG